jgi:hypothetical protein
MFLALTVAALSSAALTMPPADPHRGWLLAQSESDAPVMMEPPSETRSLSELVAERTRLKGELRSTVPGVLMIVGGAILTPVGALTALVGLLLAGAFYSTATGTGVGLMISGGVACIAGIVLLVVGANLRKSAANNNEAVRKNLDALEPRIDLLERTPPPPPSQVQHRRPQHALAPA